MRRRVITWLGALAVSASLAACGEEPAASPQAAATPEDPGQVHIHGLGVNPADGSVLVATHTGLFRVAAGDERQQRVGTSYQDTMGFAVVGPDHFLGSGHPDPSDPESPPYLGLIESRDAGRTWRPVSLHGEVDFHVLETDGERVVGYGSDFATREPRFLASEDRGRTWKPLTAPEPLVSLALAPGRPDEWLASGQRGLHRSSDAGRSWEPVDAPSPGHLAWTQDRVVLVDLEGRVWHSRDGRRWRPAGDIGGQPAAFDEGAAGELLAASHDGVVKVSGDAGRTWAVRSAP